MAKTQLTPDFKDLLNSLNEHEVRYLVVGGYAVISYGYVRATKDIDIWIAIGPDNAERFQNAMQQFIGQRPPLERVLSKTLLLRMGVAPNMIEVMTDISGVEFESCYARRQVVEVDGLRIPIMHLQDLLTNKAASGRPKDLADIDNLPDPDPA